MILAVCIVAGLALLLWRLRCLLRIDREVTYVLDAVYVKRSGFDLFPTSYDFGYPFGHRFHGGFAIEWLWLSVAFRRL